MQQENGSNGIVQPKRDLLIGLIILVIWVFFSGIGGFAFQNLDFVFRNVTFRDLIHYPWPVYYPGVTDNTTFPTFGLVYYIGHWLPAALVGKLAGWQIGNIALLIWTLIGIFLTVCYLKKLIHSSFSAATLLLVFFSGMDILGTLSIRSISPNNYPYIWPPIQHLEWWVSELFQYSSFTTQLYWAFNQAVPAWLSIALILNAKNPRTVWLIWSLCFFCAPIPAIGLIPFVLLKLPRIAFDPEHIVFRWKRIDVKAFSRKFLTDIGAMFSLENFLGGGLVFVISFFYFSANTNGTKLTMLPMNPFTFIFYFIFIIYEFFLCWILFYKEKRNNLWWYFVGGSLTLIPLIKIGNFPVFCTRASIPALFVLMVWSGEALLRKPKVNYRAALILILILGALTPIYEINRSIFRTAEYYILTEAHHGGQSETFTETRNDELPEYSHPLTLIADKYSSSLNIDPEDLPNFVSNISGSFFFHYLVSPP